MLWTMGACGFHSDPGVRESRPMQGLRGREHGHAAGDAGPATLAAGRMELS